MEKTSACDVLNKSYNENHRQAANQFREFNTFVVRTGWICRFLCEHLFIGRCYCKTMMMKNLKLLRKKQERK